MSTSITVVNRNRTLPPLLLPDLRSVHERHPYVGPQMLSGLKRTNGSDLESLASVATKRLKLSSHLVTPPPTAAVSAAISPSPSYVTFEETTTTNNNNNNNSNNNTAQRKGTSPPPEGKTTAKRQRIGPSCDECRLKKIKCDASIEILLQDDALTEQVSERLHHVFTPEEVRAQSETILKNVSLPELDESTLLIKHIDKIVLFRPCTSCRKRRATNTQPTCCLFSKGFTRADINVFSRIASRIKGKKMAEMDVHDYRAAGF